MNFLKSKATEKLLRRGEPGRHFDGQGLYLVVASGRAAHWERRYELDGKAHWMGLGSARAFSLAEARERNRRISQLLADGIDPLAKKRDEKDQRRAAAAKAMTFAEAAQAYYDQHEAKWRNGKHRAQFLNSLKAYAYPVIGKLPVSKIDTPTVLKVLERKVDGERGYPAGRFWDSRPETASRVRGRVENVIDWATVRGYRSGDNPARWRGHLDNVLPARGEIAKVEHHAALPYSELPSFVADLRAREGTAAQALLFTILTAARTNEVIGARWTEIDRVGGFWTIPAARMKASREHRVPLSEQALELLVKLPREEGNEFIFIGPRQGGLSSAAMTAVVQRMARDHITVHGFRSTFRDWAAECTSFPNEVVEMALAHVVKDKTEAAYRRGDLFEKRRKLMDAWSRYSTTPSAAATVVPLRGRR
jgi:integrase